MNDEPQMHDSGERRTFATGAVRDRGGFKPRPDLISPHANLREGAWLAKGAEKYGLDNWTKGMPIRECVASLNRHLEAYKLGQTDEDHMAAIRTNAGFILHFEEEIKAGRLPTNLDDMPKYVTPKLRCQVCQGKDCRASSAPVDANGVCPAGTPLSEGDLIAEGSPICRGEVELVTLAELKRGGPYDSKALDKIKPTFYVAGPMTGILMYNFPVFDAAANAARKLGFNVINPADMDRERGIDPVNDPTSVDRAIAADENILRTIVQRDIGVILELDKDRGDGLILLPGWERSTGARAEVGVALWMGLTFRYWDADWDEKGIVCVLKSERVKSVLYKEGS